MNGRHVRTRSFTLIHAGSDFHHGFAVRLGAVCARRELWQTKQIRHPVVADFIPATEVLVRVVVAHTPANRAGDFACAVRAVEHAEMAKRVLHPFLLAIKLLRRIHVPVMLGHKIRDAGFCNLFARLQRAVCAAVHKIVVGIHVFKQMAAFKVSHPACLPRRVQAVRQRVRFAIKRVVVLRFVNTNTPEHDAWVVPVPRDHLLQRTNGVLLPSVVTNVLPTGKLLKHEQSQLVATVEKMD